MATYEVLNSAPCTTRFYPTNFDSKHGTGLAGMDKSPLNKAHREQRRAEACLRGGRLEEAVDCHRRAAELLTEALTLSDSPLAQQSINLQHSFHLRQQEVIRFRSKQREKYAKAMENQRLKLGSGNNIGNLTAHPSKRLQAITLELTKNTEKTESLFSLLIPDIELSKDKPLLRDEASCDMKEQSSSSETVKALSPTSTEKDKASTPTGSTEKVQETSGQYSVGVKREKDNSLIVEELRTLRDHQNDLITQLMTELAQMEKENIHLRSQVRELQSKCEQYEGEKRRMRAMADSSCSPFVFSPLSEFSPDPPSFPDLAPLELPPLDFMDNCDKE
ncbi:nuclear receptor-binding factor 2-like [Palaemon carinicauda]|uniref:nuclear receptor-binding factor 2-like n=1 Tax=Palaemon carinicauda TaxID=392227 RepID=UPI0035B60FD4